ncbi:G5 domain-containing protein [Microbacterium testaceum]|uniref:G5 domain-containing protein n=1 Tax=Microbacterium testaceum TaxID=2033 RepID=UPI0009B67276|nr:G5 domain-containing protein [Microbacterium testaceum]
MSAPQPGWYPDPTDGRRWRWWNGTAWSDQIGESGRQRSSPLTPTARRKRRVPVWIWVVAGVIVFPVLLVLWPLLGAAALVVLVTGVVALATRSRTWLRFSSPAAAVAATSVAAVVVLATGGLTAAALTFPPATATFAEPAPLAQPVDGSSLSPTVPSPSGTPPLSTTAPASPTPKASPKQTPSSNPLPTRTPAPSSTPVVRVSDVSVSSTIPFDHVSVDDGNLPRGQSRVDVGGVDGEKVSVFRVTTVDGVETGRTLVSESVSREPVSEVTAVGTYDVPPPAAEPPVSEGCHPSYADACVPIDSDVDCAGGSGNGPSYFDGVARVVGPDEYDLDRDGDGWACNG